MTLKKGLKGEQNRWNTVYNKNPEELPWFGLAFPKQVETYLSQLNKSSLILIPGCGFGDTVNKVLSLGFKNVLGTDISEKAIEMAQKRFPGVPFKVTRTEDLQSLIKSHSANVFDWLNMHQVADIKEYLQSLGGISNNLCLVWICESDKSGTPVKSYVHEGNIYYHDPASVQEILLQIGLSLKEQFTFTFTTNPLSGVVREHQAIGHIYAK